MTAADEFPNAVVDLRQLIAIENKHHATVIDTPNDRCVFRIETKPHQVAIERG